MKIRQGLFILIFFISLNTTAQHQEYFPDPDPAIQQKLEEWKDLKFGLLMHWGPYSQWGVVESWSICPEDVGWADGARMEQKATDYASYLKAYEALPTTFNPTKFSPEKWAAAAKNAGMKYMVFTTKHHDGFCMFETATTDYKITNKEFPYASQPRSNITNEVFSVFRRNGFWIGAYFSKPDWNTDYYWWKRFPPADRNPNYSISKHPEQWKKFVEFTHQQIDELTTNYGKLDILWLDGGWVRPKTEEEIKEQLLEVYEGVRFARNPESQDINMPLLVKNARAKQPGLIVVDRAVPGVHQNYLTPEQHIPEEGLPYPWETCMTMATSWSYKPNDNYKSSNELIEKLVDIVSKGGNFLLNVGPAPDGTWDDTAYARLNDIGKWMQVNSSAIYGTRMYSVFGEGKDIRFTQSKDGKNKYIYFFGYPTSKVRVTKMNLPDNAKMQLLGSNAKLKWKSLAEGFEIEFPAAGKKATNYVWVVKVTE
ncbi:alpha-L-fucosidase [Pollutibacter soli]|uniref:alpha-L-fucosidase n=1 Tax=Pollutibacter soli TaxID=3034157 RepID=UPI003013AF03